MMGTPALMLGPGPQGTHNLNNTTVEQAREPACPPNPTPSTHIPPYPTLQGVP